MIRCTDYSLNADGTADVFLWSDTKDEVVPGAEIEGLPEGIKIAPFSKCMTKSKELGIMGSDGEWSW